MAQANKTDSLLSLLPTVKDTAKVNLLNQISSSYWYSNPQQTINYADKAIQLADDINFEKGLAAAYNNKGVGYYQQNNYEQAIIWYNEAIAVHKKMNNYQGEANVLSNIGLIYWKQTKPDTAVQYYLRSMRIWEEHNNEREAASLMQNIANVYSDQENYERALEYYFKALETEKKFNASPREISITLSNIGTAYLSQADNEEALKYFMEALDLLTEHDVESRAVTLSNIGITYVEMSDYDKALVYLTDALKLQEEIEDQDGMIFTLLGLAQVNEQKNQLKPAKEFAQRALDISLKIDDKNRQSEAWQRLASIAEKSGDYKNAYQYFTNMVNVRDSIRISENIHKIAHLEANYKTERRMELLKKENEQREFRRNAIGIGLIALLIIAALIVSRQRLKIRQGKELVQINEQLKKQSRQLEEQTIQLKEKDKIKSAFFANISHEFRTPLTLILNGLIDKITTAKAYGNKKELVGLELMQRNAKRLLNLINQLLDLSKLDARQMKLVLQNCDLTQLISIIHGSFSSLGSSRDIDFKLIQPEDPLLCRIDIDKFEKIIYNLLSNAFKFTPVGGTVTLSVNLLNDIIRISISDTGRGIPAEQLQKVFDRFYQGDQYYTDEQGTGIGLALTKDLVELHNGKVWAESEIGKGATFIVELPFIRANEQEEFVEEYTVKQALPEVSSPIITEEVEQDNELPTILIAEDNDDLREYISHHLSEKYKVLSSPNGKHALEKAIAEVPDLVISDWMMPEMDGITLCQYLKTDERTSHIPVILLTAVAGEEGKLKGLETGADDYLTKPFDNRELHARVKNLIDIRKQLREKYSRELHLAPKQIAVTSVDESFLKRVMETVETYMGDPDFSMEKFGQEVGLSRMQLHRKLKALTDESPGDFLRSMRLQRARRLLEARSGNVSEIAYEVGFNNLSYFSKCYREKFGILPTESVALKG